MSDIKSLQEELKYYEKLISEHENKEAKQINLQKITLGAQQNLYKTQCMYKNTNNKFQSLACLGRNFSSSSSSKCMQINNVTGNRRTVLYNQTPKFVCNQAYRNAKCYNSNLNRTVLIRADLSRSVKHTNNIYLKEAVASSSAEKKIPEEFNSVTTQIKLFSKESISKQKGEIIKDISSNPTSISFCKNNPITFKKCNYINENLVLQDREDNCKVPLENTHVKLHNRKQNMIHVKPNNKEILNKCRLQYQNPFILNKNSNKNSNRSIVMYDKTRNNSLKVLNERKTTLTNLFNKQMPQIPVSHACKTAAMFQSKYLSPNKKKVFVSMLNKTKRTDISKPLAVNKSFSAHKKNLLVHAKVNTGIYSSFLNKTQKVNKYALDKRMLKKHIISPKKTNKVNSKYKVINKATTPCSIKSKPKLQKHNLEKTNKVNSKYKVINKATIPCSIKGKPKLQKHNLELLLGENSLPLDKSDPLFELLRDSAATDKLEKELLAKNTLPVISEPVSKSQLISNYSCSGKKRFTSQFKFKKVPVKKTKVLTKYKVVNKNPDDSKNLSFKKKVSSLHKNTTKKNRISRHCLIGNESYHSTPVLNKKQVLVKRVFKSKSTIINKNATPTTCSAKMIKSKYLGLNRRKPSWQPNRNSDIHYKGHHYPSTICHLKPNKFRRFRQLVSYQQKTNRFLNYKKTAFNVPHTSSLRNRCIKKLRHGYTKSPILIKGVRYSLSSCGKTLRKLPSKDKMRSNRTPKRVLIGGRFCIRKSENLKAISPLSTNLASRVLHRSISTVLTASTKRNLTKMNTYCMFYNRFGRCNRGVKCTYIHDPSKIAVCTRFLRGTCKMDKCPFSHEIAPGKMAICSFFLVGACKKDNCPYRHENLSYDVELCKAFVQGYCPNGKECRKAHVLICPKFIQGTCEKGSACAYPHPPQKVKKNVQKNAPDDIDEKKMDDALLEKVARYFQPKNEEFPLKCQNTLDESETVKFFVPKRTTLEEQPSFIPLSNTPLSSKSKTLKVCSFDTRQEL